MSACSDQRIPWCAVCFEEYMHSMYVFFFFKRRNCILFVFLIRRHNQSSSAPACFCPSKSIAWLSNIACMETRVLLLLLLRFVGPCLLLQPSWLELEAVQDMSILHDFLFSEVSAEPSIAPVSTYAHHDLYKYVNCMAKFQRAWNEIEPIISESTVEQ